MRAIGPNDFIDFDLAVELMSHKSSLEKHRRIDKCRCNGGETKYDCLPYILQEYGRYAHLFVPEGRQFYCRVIAHIYHDDIYENIFTYWTSLGAWKFRAKCHSLVQYIAENITPAAMNRLNMHIGDFIDFAGYQKSAFGGNRKYVCIMKLLIARGLDIFGTVNGSSVYSVLKSANVRADVRGLVDMFD